MGASIYQFLKKNHSLLVFHVRNENIIFRLLETPFILSRHFRALCQADYTQYGPVMNGSVNSCYDATICYRTILLRVKPVLITAQIGQE